MDVIPQLARTCSSWNLTNGENVVQTEKDAKRLFPEELWNDLHLQIIWYGREYSPYSMIKASYEALKSIAQFAV